MTREQFELTNQVVDVLLRCGYDSVEEINLCLDEIKNNNRQGYIDNLKIRYNIKLEDYSSSSSVKNKLLRSGFRHISELIFLRKLFLMKNEEEHLNDLWISLKGIGQLSAHEIENSLQPYISGEVMESIGEYELLNDIDPDLEKYSHKMGLNNIVYELQLRIAKGILHPDILFNGKILNDWINDNIDKYEHIENIRYELDRLLQSDTIGGEFSDQYTSNYIRSLTLFIKYFSLESPTYQDLGDKYGLSRERIRQIVSNFENKMESRIETDPFPILRSAFQIAIDSGQNLIYDRWIEEIHLRDMFGVIEGPNQLKYFRPSVITIVESIINWIHKRELTNEFGKLTSQLYICLKDKEKRLSEILTPIEIRRTLHKQIIRYLLYQGGISTQQIADIFDIPLGQSNEYARQIGLLEIIPDWYVQRIIENVPNHPIHKAGLKMISAIGDKINKDEFIEGIQVYISRFVDGLAPYEVLIYTLNLLDFFIMDNKVEYCGHYLGKLSDSELIFLNEIKKIGPVVSSQEVISAFLDNGFSMQAFYALTRNSPLSMRVARSSGAFTLYRLRGVEVSLESINAATERQNHITATTRLKLDQKKLHKTLLIELGDKVKSYSSINNMPINLDLELPLPEKTRIYIYNATNPIRGQIVGVNQIQLIGPGQEKDERASFDFGDGRVVFLIGYNIEFQTFIMWDPGLYHDFSYGQIVQIDSKGIIGAYANGFEIINRILSDGRSEDVLVVGSDNLIEGINLRMELNQKRLLGEL